MHIVLETSLWPLAYYGTWGTVSTQPSADLGAQKRTPQKPGTPVRRQYPTSQTGGQPSSRRRLGWRKGSIHAAPHSCSSSVVRSRATEVLLTLLSSKLSWLSFSHAVRFTRTGGCCGLSDSEACSRSVTGAVDTRRLAQRCALRRARGYEAHESRQSLGQSLRRRWLSLRARAFQVVADLFLYIDMWGLSWTWLHPRVLELFGIRDL